MNDVDLIQSRITHKLQELMQEMSNENVDRAIEIADSIDQDVAHIKNLLAPEAIH